MLSQLSMADGLMAQCEDTSIFSRSSFMAGKLRVKRLQVTMSAMSDIKRKKKTHFSQSRFHIYISCSREKKSLVMCVILTFSNPLFKICLKEKPIFLVCTFEVLVFGYFYKYHGPFFKSLSVHVDT